MLTARGYLLEMIYHNVRDAQGLIREVRIRTPLFCKKDMALQAGQKQYEEVAMLLHRQLP